jgi:hypothetical protein
MTKIGKIPNKLPSDSVFRIFPISDLFVSAFVSDLDIRISDLFRGRTGAINFVKAVLLNISKARIY